MSALTLAFFALGLALLVGGAEALVRGASRLALHWGISPLVVGLTVVAYGTSAPELAVSVRAAFLGQAPLAVGNVVGSNICNVLLILGLCAMITPMTVAMKLIWVDVPIMIAASAALWLLGWDGALGRWDGLLLFACAIAYTVYSIWQSRRENQTVQDEFSDHVATLEKPSRKFGVLWDIALTLLGIGTLVIGSDWLVDGAVAMARHFGVSELIIGLTIVAIGTSLPEIATSIVASIRGERDIAVGNIVGSNIFNILSVLGLSSLVAPQGIEVPYAAWRLDIPIMIAVMTACLPLFFTGHMIARWEGTLFFSYYLTYVGYIVLTATNHWALSHLSHAVLFIAFPLTLVAISASLYRTWKRPHAPLSG